MPLWCPFFLPIFVDMKYAVIDRYEGCVVYQHGKAVELSKKAKQSDLKNLYKNGHADKIEEVETKSKESEADSGE